MLRRIAVTRTWSDDDVSEPSLLDQFIAALPALDAADGGQAVLQCVALPDDA
jgi:hypothetical protein